jgi:hypothetical protein
MTLFQVLKSTELPIIRQAGTMPICDNANPESRAMRDEIAVGGEASNENIVFADSISPLSDRQVS